MTDFKDSNAERALLANIIQKPDLLLNLDDRVYASAFKNPENKLIFSIVVDLYNEGFSLLEQDVVSNRIALEINDYTDLDRLDRYVRALFDSVVYPENLDKHVNSLLEVYRKTKIDSLLQNGLKALQNRDASEVMGDIQAELFKIDAGTTKSQGDGDIGRGLKEFYIERINNPQDSYGIPCGIEMIDERTLGWLKTKFYFVAARPKHGKSAFLLQSAVYAAYYAPYNRARVLYLDTEISKKEFRDRTISHIAAIPLTKVMSSEWAHDPETYQNGMQAIDLMEQSSSMFFHEYIPGFSIPQVVNLVKRYVYNYGVELIVFDYIKEPKGTDKARWQAVGDLARTLKDLGGELDVSILTALQQNRKGEGESRTNATAYAESDDVLKECDVAFMLNKKTPKEQREERLEAGTHRFQIDRGRYVSSLYNGINLKFLGYCLRFYPAAIQPTSSYLEEDEDNAVEQTANTTPAILAQ